MSRTTTDLDVRSLHTVQSETQSVEIRFRITPSLKKQIAASLEALGVRDLSSFARGALLNAIELARLGRDPKWAEFIQTVNAGPARAILGHGLAMPQAQDIESRGTERRGRSAADFVRVLSGRKKRPAVKA